MQQPKEQSIAKKLGSILGIGASKASPTPQKTIEDLGKLEHSTFFNEDVLRELDSSVPTQRRLRAMKEKLELVAKKRLEEHATESIWLAIQDLMEPSQPTEVRHVTLAFVRNLIFGQFEDLGVLRAHFLSVIQKHNVKEDAQLRLEILRVLTHEGKDIHHLEETIGPFLLSWMPEVVNVGLSKDFLTLLVNFVHYNAAYMDVEVLVGVVSLTCALARKSGDPNVLSVSGFS